VNKVIVIVLLLTGQAWAQNFDGFLQTIVQKSLQQGVSKQTLEAAFAHLTPDPKVLEYDKKQAEFSLNFWRYLRSRVNDNRLWKGQSMLKNNQLLLKEMHQKYGVHPSVLVAFWGLESNYGVNTGKMNLIRSLATLSFDKRRRAFFTRELLALLKLIDAGKLPFEAQGSWAGAMGNMQFMPSNVAAYGVDANSDGKIDLWNSQADIFASAANFLQHIGWKSGEKWGREVKLPSGFDFSQANLKNKKDLTEWQALGVRDVLGQNLPKADMRAALVLPMGHQGPAFLVYRNFYAILNWNRSILYALSVGHLSDKLINGESLMSFVIDEPSLSRDDVFLIQTQLNDLGFDTGKADGISGPKTRAAVRLYQQAQQLPVDGYVGYRLLLELSK
jgi:membrane-bound lytic murein transglycosylase B